MLKVKSKVKINTMKIKQINAAGAESLEETAEALHEEVQQAQVIPRRNGTLQGEGFFVDTSKSKRGKVTLVNSTLYARRWYYNPEGANFHHSKWKDKKGIEYDGNPNAKDHWFEDWMPGGKNEDFVQKSFTRRFRRKMEGFN